MEGPVLNVPAPSLNQIALPPPEPNAEGLRGWLEETVLPWVAPHGTDPEQVEGVQVVEPLGGDHVLISLPRYVT